MALEREKNKLVLEKCQNILKELLKDEDNKYCVDCDAKSPRWASWNIGIFLCIRCAGIHRNLGVHISRVKSVNLDAWTPQQVACIQQMGNSRARAVYEANLQDNFRRPQTDSSLEQFIRAKYEAKKYIAREWVPPPMPNPTWDVEIEKMLKKKRDKKSVGSGGTEFPAPVKSSSSKLSVSPKPLPKAPGGRNNSPSQSKRIPGNSSSSTNKELNQKEKTSSGSVDLLSLDVQATSNGTVESDTDIFGDFLTAPVPSTVPDASNKDGKDPTSQSDESSFFNQKLPEASSEKLTKDSILALYSQTSHSQQQTAPLSVYGGGMFIGGPGVPSAVPQPVLGMYQQQPQNMMLLQQTGTNMTGIQPTMYSQGMPVMGGPVYPMMPPSLPQGIPGVQLSAANPFAHVQTHMSNLSIGGLPGGVHPQPKIPSAVLTSGTAIGNPSLPTTAQQTTLSNNLWQ